MLEFDLTDLHQAPEWHDFVKQALVCVCVCVSSAVAGQDWLKCFECPQFSDKKSRETVSAVCLFLHSGKHRHFSYLPLGGAIVSGNEGCRWNNVEAFWCLTRHLVVFLPL